MPNPVPLVFGLTWQLVGAAAGARSLQPQIQSPLLQPQVWGEAAEPKPAEASSVIPETPPNAVDPYAAALIARDQVRNEREAALTELAEAKASCQASGTSSEACRHSDQRVLAARARAQVLADTWHRLDAMVPVGQKLSDELRAANKALANASQANDQVQLKLRTEAGNDRGMWHAIDQEIWAEKNLSAFASFMKKRESVMQEAVENVSVIEHQSQLRISQFSVKLRGIIQGLDVGDKFAEQTFVDAERDLAKAHKRNARATQMTKRAERLINGTNMWLERTRKAEEMVKDQKSGDSEAQKKLQAEAKRLEAETKADSKILRGLVRENFDDFGSIHGSYGPSQANETQQDPLDGTREFTSRSASMPDQLDEEKKQGGSPEQAPADSSSPAAQSPAMPPKDEEDKAEQAKQTPPARRPPLGTAIYGSGDPADQAEDRNEADRKDKVPPSPPARSRASDPAIEASGDKADQNDQADEQDQTASSSPSLRRVFSTPIYGSGDPARDGDQADEDYQPPLTPSPAPPTPPAARRPPLGAPIYGSGSLAASPTSGAINILASPRSRADPTDLGSASAIDDDAELYEDLRRSSDTRPMDVPDPASSSDGRDGSGDEEAPSDLSTRGADQDVPGAVPQDSPEVVRSSVSDDADQEAPAEGPEASALQPESNLDPEAKPLDDDYPQQPLRRVDAVLRRHSTRLRQHAHSDTPAFDGFGPLARELSSPLGGDHVDDVVQDADEADDETGTFDADADRA